MGLPVKSENLKLMQSFAERHPPPQVSEVTKWHTVLDFSSSLQC